MIIYNLDVLGSALSPNETDSPLIIDSYAVLPFPVAAQGLEPVSRNGRDIFQGFGIVEHAQFSACDVGNIAELPIALAMEQFLGVTAAEGADHTKSISRLPLNTNQYFWLHFPLPQGAALRPTAEELTAHERSPGGGGGRCGETVIHSRAVIGY